MEQQGLQVSYLLFKDVFAMVQNYSCTADLVLTNQFIASTVVAMAQFSAFIDCIADSDFAVRAANTEVYLFEVESYSSSYFDLCHSIISCCRIQHSASMSIITSVDSFIELVCCPVDQSKEDLVELDQGYSQGRKDSKHFSRLLSGHSIKPTGEVSVSFN